jgi:hypothetical protein
MRGNENFFKILPKIKHTRNPKLALKPRKEKGTYIPENRLDILDGTELIYASHSRGLLVLGSKGKQTLYSGCVVMISTYIDVELEIDMEWNRSGFEEASLPILTALGVEHSMTLL